MCYVSRSCDFPKRKFLMAYKSARWGIISKKGNITSFDCGNLFLNRKYMVLLQEKLLPKMEISMAYVS